MFAAISLLLGILVAVIILSVARREPKVVGSAPEPTALGWWTFAFGLIAVTALVLAMRLTSSGPDPSFVFWNLSIGFGFATAVAGVRSLMMHDRHWPTWVGLVAGLGPVIFWIAFAIGNILSLGE